MTTMWAMLGRHTDDLLTYQGRPVIHDSREELEWLLPPQTFRAVRVTVGDLRKRSPLPALWLKDHPDITSAGITFPLDRRRFLP